MIKLRQRVLWASMLATATLASAAAFAQPAPAAPAAMPTTPAAQAPIGKAGPAADHRRAERGDPAQRFARMQEHRAKRMAAMKEKLKLNPSQESAWTNFTASTQPPAGPPPQRPDRAEFAKLTTPQRLERMQARQAERSAMFAKRAEATKTFYAALNADQQKTFDTETAHMGHGGPRGRGGHWGHGGPDGHRPSAPAKG